MQESSGSVGAGLSDTWAGCDKESCSSRAWSEQLDKILWTSDSEAGLKTEKLGGVAGGEGECGDNVAGLLVREKDGVWIFCL